MIFLVQHLSIRPPRTSASIPPHVQNQNPHPISLPQNSGRGAEALPLPSIPSIAVLPFTNLSGDPQQEYFSDGIAAQLIDDLSRLPGLFVIARNSSFAYKGRSTKEHEIGRELGVKYVMEGSVRKAADQLRIGVELVDAGSGTEMWTQRFDRPLKDVFAVQDEIVSKVMNDARAAAQAERNETASIGKCPANRQPGGLRRLPPCRWIRLAWNERQ
jgi:TolB-like protein